MIDGGPTAATQRFLLLQTTQLLCGSLIEWASSMAACGSQTTQELVEFLTALPESREELRADLVEALGSVMGTPECMNAALPFLYSSMLGADVRLRGGAARALGNLRSGQARDLPNLVFEALLLLANDPYVFVHRSALRALERLRLPDHLRDQGRDVTYNVLLAYLADRKKDSLAERFTVELIDYFTRVCANPEDIAGPSGLLLVEALQSLDAGDVSRDLPWLTAALAEVPGFLNVVLRVLLDREERHQDLERVVSCLEKVPDDALLTGIGELRHAGEQLIAQGSHPSLIVEPLVRVGCWEDAMGLVEQALQSLSNSPKDRIRVLELECLLHALRLESAAASGNWHQVDLISLKLSSLVAEFEELSGNAHGFDPEELFGSF